MTFYGASGRCLIQKELDAGVLADASISECDISNLTLQNLRWSNNNVRDSHGNGISFLSVLIEQSKFFRSDFMKTICASSQLLGVQFDGMTLIKSCFTNSHFADATIRNTCMQRAHFDRDKFVSSVFQDFEALNMQINNSIFIDCTFTLTYGNGMNGFSGAKIKNTIFYNCRFEGFPLRGAILDSCVFVHCNGEIGDDMDIENVAGLALVELSKTMPLSHRNEAEVLLQQFV